MRAYSGKTVKSEMASAYVGSQLLEEIGRPSASAGGVLMIGPVPPPRGGISIHICRLCRLYEQQGISYRLLDESRLAKPGVAQLRGLSPLAYFRLLRDAGLVHIHTSNRYLRLAHTIAARVMGKPVLQTVHGHDRRFWPRLCLRAACLLSQERIAVSEEVAREIGLSALVIPAFIGPAAGEDDVPADVASWIEKRKQEGKTVLALNASRLTFVNEIDVYGVDLLISAFMRPEVRNRCAAVVCIADIDRDRRHFHHLNEWIKREALEDRILLRRGDIEFSGVLKLCDLFVRPTSTDGDAVSVREALWLGIPTIGSDAVPRPAGVVIFQSRDANDLASKILANVTAKRTQNVTTPCYGEQVLEACKRLLKGKSDVAE